MKTLKGWNRYTPLKAKINVQLAHATTDTRLLSLINRIQVVESAIRKMNHNNGMFLDKPYPAAKYSLEQMKKFQSDVIAKGK